MSSNVVSASKQLNKDMDILLFYHDDRFTLFELCQILICTIRIYLNLFCTTHGAMGGTNKILNFFIKK